MLILLQHLKLNNLLYHNIEINLEDIPNFLINDKCSVDFISNIWSKIDVNEEIAVIVQKNDLSNKQFVSDVHSGLLVLPFQLFVRTVIIPKAVVLLN